MVTCFNSSKETLDMYVSYDKYDSNPSNLLEPQYV